LPDLSDNLLGLISDLCGRVALACLAHCITYLCAKALQACGDFCLELLAVLALPRHIDRFRDLFAQPGKLA